MGKKWTADDIPDRSGRVAIVTGANSGIGFETAGALAAKGATVIAACRSREKGEAAVERIRAAHPGSEVELMQLDLASLDSVMDFAGGFSDRFHRLDLLINNAGIMMCPYGKTVDGFELQFGTNHLGHFALTGRLLGIVLGTPGARVVTVSSMYHRRGRIDFDNLNAEKGYDRNRAYAASKLANLLFAYELDRRLRASGADAISTAAHPGWTGTNLQRYSTLFRAFNPLLSQKPHMGALPTLYAATAPEVRGGDYFGPGGIGEVWGYPVKVKSSEVSHNRGSALRLWRLSEELTGVNCPLAE